MAADETVPAAAPETDLDLDPDPDPDRGIGAAIEIDPVIAKIAGTEIGIRKRIRSEGSVLRNEIVLM